MLKRLAKVTALAGSGLLLTGTAAVAHPTSTYVEDGAYDNAKATHGHDSHQHGGQDGHISVRNYGFDLVSKLRLSRVVEGKVADVGVHKDIAYLAAWGGQTCKYNGVHVVDIKDLQNPTEIAFIPSKEGSYPGEGVQALTITTNGVTRDILVTNNEKCRESSGFGGLNIYDVTDPRSWTKLAEGFGDAEGHNSKQSSHQIHSVFAWQAGSRAYAVMVDNEESADVDVVDITDPAKPVLIAEYDLARDMPQVLQSGKGLDEVFLHDMVVKQIGGRQVMLLSYWDGGYVQLDVTDPLRPRYLGDSDFPDPDTIGAQRGLRTPDGRLVPPEGNAHQAEYTADNRFVLAADEDFSPFALVARNVTDGTALAAGQGSDTVRLQPGQQIKGPTYFAGRACNGDPAVPPAPVSSQQQVAVVERGVCTFTEKVANVAGKGYEAVLIFNRTGTDGCDGTLGMSVEGPLPAFGVAPRGQGFALFDAAYDNAACLAGTGPALLDVPLGTVGDTVDFQSYFDGWGYVRLFDTRSGKMTQLDTYAIPEAHDVSKAVGFGDLSVHEVATSQQRSDVAYLSYYSGGARALKISEKAGKPRLTEVGAYIDEGGNNFWGVETFVRGGQEYVALSDRDFGLYILRPSP